METLRVCTRHTRSFGVKPQPGSARQTQCSTESNCPSFLESNPSRQRLHSDKKKNSAAAAAACAFGRFRGPGSSARRLRSLWQKSQNRHHNDETHSLCEVKHKLKDIWWKKRLDGAFWLFVWRHLKVRCAGFRGCWGSGGRRFDPGSSTCWSVLGNDI